MGKHVLINGALGHMGQAVLASLKTGDGALSPAAGVDLRQGDFPGVLFSNATGLFSQHFSKPKIRVVGP